MTTRSRRRSKEDASGEDEQIRVEASHVAAAMRWAADQIEAGEAVADA
jgi:hypothetical protein